MLLQAPDVFGEDCVLGLCRARGTSAWARTACHLRTLQGEALREVLRRFPDEQRVFLAHAKSRMDFLAPHGGDEDEGADAKSTEEEHARAIALEFALDIGKNQKADMWGRNQANTKTP